MDSMDRYAAYKALRIVRHDKGILELAKGARASANKKLSTADQTMHRELPGDAPTGRRRRARGGLAIFDASLALEFMGFSGPDVKEGIASLRGRRKPDFDSSCPF